MADCRPTTQPPCVVPPQASDLGDWVWRLLHCAQGSGGAITLGPQDLQHGQLLLQSLAAAMPQPPPEHASHAP
eukprot:3348019-Lingulodinium_polyedra.AAC.1